MDHNPATNTPGDPARDVAGSGESHAEPAPAVREDAARPREIGGRGGLDPVRYGDWEKDGRCIDF